jgi:hypothetical protein
VNRSKRARRPLPQGQMAIFSREHEGTEYQITIVFDYGQGENHIRIVTIQTAPLFESPF